MILIAFYFFMQPTMVTKLTKPTITSAYVASSMMDSVPKVTCEASRSLTFYMSCARSMLLKVSHSTEYGIVLRCHRWKIFSFFFNRSTYDSKKSRP